MNQDRAPTPNGVSAPQGHTGQEKAHEAGNTDLLKLAARCGLEEPSRELDCQIAFAVTGDIQVSIKGPLRAPLPYMLSEAVARPSELHQIAADDSIDMIPRYTSSLDAAVTLVPANTYWSVSKGKITADEPLYGAMIEDAALSNPKELGIAESDHHEALALCAAALHARSLLSKATQPVDAAKDLRHTQGTQSEKAP